MRLLGGICRGQSSLWHRPSRGSETSHNTRRTVQKESPMLLGNKNRFAVEWEITLKTARWVYGYFWFYLNGHRIGSEEDSSVDLNGCKNWIRDFVNMPLNRYEDHLYDLPKEVVFERLAGENAEVEGTVNMTIFTDAFIYPIWGCLPLMSGNFIGEKRAWP